MTAIEQAPATPQPYAPSPVEVVLGLALGYLTSRSLHVATNLGIADLLVDGPKSVSELADKTGTDGPSLYRLLRTLAAEGVFAEEQSGDFRLTPAAELLRSGFLRDGVQLCGEVTGDGSWWNAVGQLRHAVQTGEPSFEHQHGMGFFEYLADRPECRQWFDRGLANFAAAENPAIAAAYEFAGIRHVVDVGGGQGGFLAEILRRSPGLEGTLFDLASVVREPAYLASADLSNRWRTASGDFFESVPSGADAYMLKRILHDWSDGDCVRILRSCRAAMDKQARLLIVDAVIPPGNGPHPAKVMDILMMVFGAGRERTQVEFAEILEQADLRLVKVVPTPTALAIVEVGVA